MTSRSSRQTNFGGIILTLAALALALGVVIWLVADTPLDGGTQVATDPPALKQITDPDAPSLRVSPEPKGALTTDPGAPQ